MFAETKNRPYSLSLKIDYRGKKVGEKTFEKVVEKRFFEVVVNPLDVNFKAFSLAVVAYLSQYGRAFLPFCSDDVLPEEDQDAIAAAGGDDEEEETNEDGGVKKGAPLIFPRFYSDDRDAYINLFAAPKIDTAFCSGDVVFQKMYFNFGLTSDSDDDNRYFLLLAMLDYCADIAKNKRNKIKFTREVKQYSGGRGLPGFPTATAYSSWRNICESKIKLTSEKTKNTGVDNSDYIYPSESYSAIEIKNRCEVIQAAVKRYEIRLNPAIAAAKTESSTAETTTTRARTSRSSKIDETDYNLLLRRCQGIPALEKRIKELESQIRDYEAKIQYLEGKTTI